MVSGSALWGGDGDHGVSEARARSDIATYCKLPKPFSLRFRTLGYTISRETQNLQVPYFVDKNFDKSYRGASLHDLEKTIEKDYIDYIQTSCWKEKQQSKMPSKGLSLVAGLPGWGGPSFLWSLLSTRWGYIYLCKQRQRPIQDTKRRKVTDRIHVART